MNPPDVQTWSFPPAARLV